MNCQQHNKRGLTVVELLVGLTVFAIAMTITVLLLTAGIRNQRLNIASQNIQDNARYLMGFISKEIRMSRIRSLDAPTGTAILDITRNVDGIETDITYEFTGTQITRDIVDEDPEPVNSDQVIIEGRFYIDGRSVGDDEHPRVTIVMRVRTTGIKVEEQTEINLQTTLSSRRYPGE